MGIKSIIATTALSVLPVFSHAAPEKVSETNAHATKQPASCTVRLNRYTDNAPDDSRYIGTKYADLIQSTGSFSGITYSQPLPLQSENERFKFTDKNPVDFLDKSFRSAVELDGRYKGKEYHYDSEYYIAQDVDRQYSQGVIINSRFANWTQSYEVDLNDPERCLAIKHQISAWAPLYRSLQNLVFSNLPTHTSNSFADAVWAHTGLSGDPEELKKNPAVRIISREERLNKPRYQFGNKQDLPSPILEK